MTRRMTVGAVPILHSCVALASCFAFAFFSPVLASLPGGSRVKLAAQEVPAIGGAEAGDSIITLPEVLELARSQNPRLRAAALEVQATRSREPGAGALPDPMLQLGVMNLALPEFSATMPASMAPSVQATQRIPFPGKLSLRKEIATRSTAMEEASAEDVWWTVRTEAASAFYRLWEVDRRIAVMRATRSLLEDFHTIAESMYSAGGGRQADVLRASVEVARMDAEIERMIAMRRAAEARLNAVLDRPPESPVPSPSFAGLPSQLPPSDTLFAWGRETRPALRRMRAAVARAATAKALADKEIWPDFNVGLQYGLGRMAGDPRSMGGVMVGFSLPVHAKSRQYKAREEAAAVEGAARAALDESVAEMNARIAELTADAIRSRTLLTLYREEILPQSRSTVESSLSSYRVGAVDFTTLLDAEMAENRFQGEYYTLLASYGTALAQLEMAIGRDLPVTDERITEAR